MQADGKTLPKCKFLSSEGLLAVRTAKMPVSGPIGLGSVYLRYLRKEGTLPLRRQLVFLVCIRR